MDSFLKKHSTIIVTYIGIVFAVALAIISAFLTINTAKNAFSDNISSAYSVTFGNTADIASSATPSTDEPIDTGIPLVISSPSRLDSTVSESHFAITGSCDPDAPLTMNGIDIPFLESGEFSIDVELSPGKNTFTFEHKGKTTVCVIRYDFTVISAYAPYEKQTYEAGSSFTVVACARIDSSSVTATFNGQTINLTPQPHADGVEFVNYTGTFTMPTGNESAIDLGGVTFAAVCQGVTQRFKSPSIICLRDAALDRTQIVEIVISQAETFNGNTKDNWSDPRNSYLPKGTVDYKVGGITYDADSENSFYTLRCGKRVCVNKENPPDAARVTVATLYEGELPEYNTISLASTTIQGNQSVLTFDTAWKAPFSVDIAPQTYINPAERNFNINGATYSYVDIKFFYTQNIGGDFTAIANNPLFSSAQILPTDNGYTLRLHLKQTGCFYGWNAEYNENGQLEFKFLNPAVITAPNNLTGIKILIDAGHGGRDVGALGLRPDTMYEAERNLSLAYKLKAELEAYGATVIMSRTGDTSLTADARCDFLRQQAPDLCVSIHHDSSSRASASGGSIFCFNAFSNYATQCVYNRVVEGNFYSNNLKSWHYFFLARVTSCPVVLTENGFISNPQDFVGISDENVNVLKAKSIAQGVLDYFNSFVQ